MKTSEAQVAAEAPARADFASRFLRWLAVNVFLTALLFLPAGRWDLPMLWAYAAVMSSLALAAVLKLDPTVTRERLRWKAGGLDPVALALIRLLALAHLIVAGLDVGRFHWSDTVPRGLQVPALMVFAGCVAWTLWAISANRFFSPYIRIQEERGHQPVTDGPYRYVRHPGYLGMIFVVPASALALGSWWALVPAVAYSVLIFRRVILEDRFLKEKLEGYADYAAKVRYRQVPGLW